MTTTRLAILWSYLSGYMGACWRTLAERGTVSPFVVAWKPSAGGNIAFRDDVVAGAECRLLDERERADSAALIRMLEEAKPRVLLVGGWWHPPYRAAIKWAKQRGIPVIMTMDTSLQHTARQYAARWLRPVLNGGVLNHVDRIFVPGERAAMMARFLKFREDQIRIGSYAYDASLFTPCVAQRAERHARWPRRFLFVGRYLPRKALDDLVAAYRTYRSTVDEPWTLTCCGTGPLASLLANQSGIEDRNFVQPEELPGIMSDCGAFVFPSRFEAWGVALAEAACAGLPLIASQSVGAAVEILGDNYNGRIVPTNAPAQLAQAMRWIHDNEVRLPEVGRRSAEMAAPFAAEYWARAVEQMCADLLSGGAA